MPDVDFSLSVWHVATINQSVVRACRQHGVYTAVLTRRLATAKQIARSQHSISLRPVV